MTQSPTVMSDKRTEALTEREFTKVSMDVLGDSGIRGISPRLLYSLLLMKCANGPRCALTIKHLIDLTGMSRRSVQTSMRLLEAQGVVISTPRTDENGRSEANEYFLPKLQEAIDEFVAKKNRKSSARTRNGPVAS
jgi:hypothetical protein